MRIISTLILKGAIVLLVVAMFTPLFSQSLSAQSVTGKIVGDDNEVLAGAMVVVKGSSRAVVSDASGSFSIAAKQGETLIFSHIGYRSREVTIGRRGETLKITLPKSSVDVDEVVVIGYGSVRKRDLTGSVASMKGSDLLPPTHRGSTRLSRAR